MYLNLIKKPFSELKKILSLFKTYLIKNNILFGAKDKSKSYSVVTQKYADFALKAAIDSKEFSIFRRHHDYTRMLEHAAKKEGQACFEIIHNKYKLSINEINEAIEPLQTAGNPKLQYISGLGRRVSCTALRYLKIALDIKKLKGENLGHVVEIGCGYGGQAIILDKIGKIKSYTFLDLWQVNLLIKRFIENSQFSAKYTISTIRNLNGRKSWDLVISNYAFSELAIDLQKLYFNEILSNSDNGYMIMNTGREEESSRNLHLSKKYLLNKITGCVCTKEVPSTSNKNYLLSWNGKKI